MRGIMDRKHTKGAQDNKQAIICCSLQSVSEIWRCCRQEGGLLLICNSAQKPEQQIGCTRHYRFQRAIQIQFNFTFWMGLHRRAYMLG